MFLIFNGENGKTAKINIENIIQRFSDDIGFDVKSAGIMLDKKDSSICAWSDDLHEEKSDYPGIWVTGTYSMHNLDISRTELPNVDNETVTTYLYAGRNGQETDDWLLSVHDGERDSEDESRRLVIIDEDITSAISAKEATGNISVPVTEQQAKDKHLCLLF